ncbi:MAG: hypothetical protein LBD92_03430 [Oscillospiraceae bacterium]|jgi:hypothetical protein|nr:hypothetical protein [Oscillospiraceae bacterium]
MAESVIPLPPGRRVVIITGHYGSGKTEFAVSLALALAAVEREFPRLALIDLDIANPYFRSRERRALLEGAGVSVYGSLYRDEITAELPALGAAARAPLQDAGCLTLVDAGGNDSGALVLNQFRKDFPPGATAVLAVVNASRPETASAEGAVRHIRAIESVTGLNVEYIVNNCHLLRETTVGTIRRGHELCERVCEATGKLLLCDCYPAPVVRAGDVSGIGERVFPLGLYMRETWQ